MKPLDFGCTMADNPGKTFREAAFNPGVHASRIDALVYRRAITTHYVLEMPELRAPPARDSRVKFCEGAEKGRYLLLCNFVNGTNTFMRDLTQSVQILLSSMQMHDASAVRRKREALDFLWKGVLGVATDSDVRQVMTSETQMYERLKQINFFLKMQNLDEKQLMTKLNMWTDRVSNVTSETLAHAEGFEIMMRNTSAINEQLAAFAAITSSTLTSHLLLLSHYLRESAILSDCDRGRIPFEGIAVKDFQSNLLSMSAILKTKNMSLSIDPNNIHTYANAKIATCKRSKTQLVVAVLLPIMKAEDSKVTVHKVTPIFFRYNDQHCALLKKTQVVLKTLQPQRVIILDEKSGTECLQRALCHIPRVTTSNILSECLTDIMIGETLSSFSKKCHFLCDGDMPLTRVTELDDNLFAVSTLSSNVTLTCVEKTRPLEVPEVGAMTVTIPCECQLSVDGVVHIDNSINCRENKDSLPDPKFILPALWSDNAPETLSFPDAQEKAFTLMKGNMSDIVNTDWKLNISHIDLPKPGPALQDDFWHKPDFGLPYTGLVWKLILTILIFCALVKLCRVGNRFYSLRSALRDALRETASPADVELADRPRRQ